MSPAVTPPPAGTTWTGEWDSRFHDRVFGGDPVAVDGVAALLTGVQHRSGSTISGVALRVAGTTIGDGRECTVTADLTPGQARELAEVLTTLADRAENLDGITPRPDSTS